MEFSVAVESGEVDGLAFGGRRRRAHGNALGRGYQLQDVPQRYREQTQRETNVDCGGKNIQKQLGVLWLEMLEEIFGETVGFMPLYKA